MAPKGHVSTQIPHSVHLESLILTMSSLVIASTGHTSAQHLHSSSLAHPQSQSQPSGVHLHLLWSILIAMSISSLYYIKNLWGCPDLNRGLRVSSKHDVSNPTSNHRFRSSLQLFWSPIFYQTVQPFW